MVQEGELMPGPGTGGMSSFVGYEDPPRPEDIRKCKDWPERLLCLTEHHLGEWAKFGPFMSKKSAQHTGANVRGQMEHVSRRHVLDTEVHPEGEAMNGSAPYEPYFLWVRAREKD